MLIDCQAGRLLSSDLAEEGTMLRRTAALTAILIAVHTSAAPLAETIAPARERPAGHPDQTTDKVQVSVCIPSTIVDDWDHTDRDRRMSDFKDYVATYVEDAHNTRVQYRMTEGAFAAFNPAAPDPQGMFELVDAGQPCPATMTEYTLPVVPAEVVDVARAAYDRGLQFDDARRYADAAREYEIAARAGNADAADALAVLYYAGNGVPQSFSQAAVFARQAADHGSAQGAYHMGLLSARGLGVAHDEGQAAIWFRRAGDGGVADGYAHLGRLYAAGSDANFAIARSWLQEAADRGSVYGALNLGYLYETGRGVAQDDAIAVAWFRKAAEQNDAEAMCQLGMHLRTGKGVAWSEAEAMQWFRTAADLGDTRAQTQLAYGYSQGLGKDAGQGRQDFQAAAFWYGKAAAAGDPLAQIDLGLLYQNGWGVEQNLTRARELYAQAAASDDADAAKLARQFAARVPSESQTSTDGSDWVGPAIAGGLAVLAVYALTRGSSGDSSSDASEPTVWRDPMLEYQQDMDRITNCVVSGGHLDLMGQGICFH